ncbi:hypothetical protein SAMN06296386_102334 [Lachnospiraceae bacterium]|nr:hypothetical protein SAMN06296386_102334 [Lachnospiraceae bacterium]
MPASFDQWKEYYIADQKPNLSELVLEEPLKIPGTDEMDFVKLTLLQALDIGHISVYLADRVRTIVNMSLFTGKDPAEGLHDLIIEEIELNDQSIINLVFGKKAPSAANKNAKADTWWAEEALKGR